MTKKEQKIEEKIREEIRKSVIDPEIGINIVDMGLIYYIRVEGEKEVRIKMTLTSMTCPEGPKIMDGVRSAAEKVCGLPAHLDLVWEPAWNKDMLSYDAKNELGFT